MKVAVVGGGWAGLAAAVELSTAGIEVTVFEAARQLGGRARSVETHGQTLDNGQHILIGAYSETLRLMQRVGADPECLLKRLPLELNYPGSGFLMKLPRLPAPFHLALGLLSAKGCTLGEKFRAVHFMRFLQSHEFRLAADCSVGELLDRHRQHGSLRKHLWEPLCLAALNTAPENGSAQIFANVLRDSLGGCRADTDLLLPTTDLNRVFPQAAVDYIEARGGKIHRSTRIETIAAPFELHGERFGQLILAVAPQHAAILLAKQPETAAIAGMLAEYSYEPIATVYAGYPTTVELPCPMLGLDDGSGQKLGQWVFDRGVLGGTRGLMGFVLSAHGNWDQRENTALCQALHGELEAALGRTLPQALWHQVIREQRATFSCRPKLPRAPAKTPLPGLWLAGDHVCAGYPATLEGAVRSGMAAASGILDTVY